MRLTETIRKTLSDIEKQSNFKNWFGNSILKHEDGRPQEFYHGTAADISQFSFDHVGKGNDQYGSGFYFTDSPSVAGGYTDHKGEHQSPNVLKVHLRLENPIFPNDKKPLRRDHIKKLIMLAPDHKESLMNYGDVDYEGYNKVLNMAVDSYTQIPKFHAMNSMNNDFYRDHEGQFLKNFKQVTKHDGVITTEGSSTIVNIFHPNQIKSAIGNTGEYKDSPVITESIEDIMDVLHTFRHKWNDLGVKNFAYPNKGIISLSQLVVPKEARNKGVGTKFMQELTSIADEHQHTITLTPSSDFGGTKTRLVDFYKRHGFVTNSGSNKDYTISDTMYRKPAILSEGFDGFHPSGEKESKTPEEHVSDVINSYKTAGWETTKPWSFNKDSESEHGVETKVSFIHMPTKNKYMDVHFKFSYPLDRKQSRFLIKHQDT